MTATGERAAPAYVSSIVALVLGVGLAVGVSAIFGLLGWGGELASQTAGAASGAAPLIIDGVRRRRRPRALPSLLALTKGMFYRPKLWIASALGFALLLLDTVCGLVFINVAQGMIELANGDPARITLAYALLGSVTTLPVVIGGTYLLGIAAGHRLGPERQRRWILLGVGIYTVVRVAVVIAAGSAPDLGMTPATILVGVVLTVPLIALMALLGARRARRTQAAYYAKVYFRRLSPSDQEAALALLDESVTRSAA